MGRLPREIAPTPPAESEWRRGETSHQTPEKNTGLKTGHYKTDSKNLEQTTSIALSSVAASDEKMYLLQNACVFELDQLVQVEILESLAAREFDELRRDALNLCAHDFVNVGLEAGCLQALDEVRSDALDFERDPF